MWTHKDDIQNTHMTGEDYFKACMSQIEDDENYPLFLDYIFRKRSEWKTTNLLQRLKTRMEKLKINGSLDIPISAAKNIAIGFHKSQVIIATFDENGYTTITTYGKSITDAQQAAEGGNWIKKQLGWPPEDCQDVPERVKKRDSITVKRLLSSMTVDEFRDLTKENWPTPFAQEKIKEISSNFYYFAKLIMELGDANFITWLISNNFDITFPEFQCVPNYGVAPEIIQQRKNKLL